MTRIKVLKPFTSSGRCYNVGQVYDMMDAHARDLIAGGLAKKAEAAAAASTTTKSTTKSTAKSPAKSPAKKSAKRR